jgi:methylmalonyl-CoA mutase
MTSEQPVEGGLDEPAELEPAQGALALADASDVHTRADWEAAAAAVLRKDRRLGEDDADASVWSHLARTTLDGVAVPALGTPDLLDGLVTSGRPTRVGGWDVVTRPADNGQALADLDTGASALWVAADAHLPSLLDGVLLDLAPVVLDGATPQQARSFLDALGYAEPAAGTNLGADAAGPHLVEVAALAREAEVLAGVVDGTVVHDRGASDVQELGYVLGIGASALRQLTAAGFSVADAAGLLELRLAATDEQFVTISKFRAVRRLWARVLELSGVDDPAPVRIHAVTSRPMMSAYDPWVNLLRTTVAAFAAGVGGADAITVVPFDSPLGQPDTFGRRIARNTSHLLVAESHLGRVADPAGGAYAVEKLTDELAVAAWEELGRIESDGLEALDERIADVVARRDAEVATRARPITGLTEFPNLGETLPTRSGPGDDVRRYGAAFEALRDEPAASPVFLATMGTVAAHTARAMFATNLFAAGGVAVAQAGATDGVDAVLAAYEGQQVVCVCGTDAAYEDWGAALVAALREAGARHVVLAGTADVGADDRCHVGIDALEFLRRTRGVLG